jgi:putative methyltransferase (TIGR04325 family)
MIGRILNKVKRILGLNKPRDNGGWFGNYSSWEEAEKECKGYDSKEILKKVRESVMKVKNGSAVYERDSVLFDEIQYSPELIKSFNASVDNNKLHVTDFGGSLGSSYFQHKSLFNKLSDFKWAVVEQKHFVDCGIRDISTDHLKFYYTIEEALKINSPQVLLLSSVIPYFKDPYGLISKMLTYKFEYIIIDRTAFIESKTERITKQVVPEYIYKASYPAWFLNEEKFISKFTGEYELVSEFNSEFDPIGHLEDGVKVYRKGFYFKLKKSAA